MKSIMEEGSSIMKAIERAWMKAGQPKEFSIKVFEEPQKNFIGLTVRSAKIGIFFTDAAVAPKQEAHAAKQRPANVKQPKISPAVQKVKEKPQPQPQPAPKKEIKEYREPKIKEVLAKPESVQIIQKPAADIVEGSNEPRVNQPVWTDVMVNDVGDWLKEALTFISIRPITFSKDAQHFHLKINFSESIFEDKGRERQLFSSLATLLLQMLKHKYRRPLKGYKIILTTP